MRLAVLDGDVVLNVHQITGRRSIVSERWVGRRTPYHCKSNWKVLVAFLPEAERERRLSSPRTRETRAAAAVSRRLTYVERSQSVGSQ